MQHDPRAWLWDVRRPADLTAEFVGDRSFDDYLSDALLRAAVERQLEIVGEALNRLAKEAPALARRIPDLRPAIGTRNILIHGYRDVDHAAIWRTVQHNLPALRAEVGALLEEVGEEP